ncbi:hypothetical protein [Burkholderia contaminans]|uniref:hypothetical protein n=1 Tax=Burkholderia contaminans TaxID=488447 RepID=UPI001583E4B8|nr:hypothetical protein [Burkholderia contaminans]
MPSLNKISLLKTNNYFRRFVLRNVFWHRETGILCPAPRIFTTQRLVPHREILTGLRIGEVTGEVAGPNGRPEAAAWALPGAGLSGASAMSEGPCIADRRCVRNQVRRCRALRRIAAGRAVALPDLGLRL